MNLTHDLSTFLTWKPLLPEPHQIQNFVDHVFQHNLEQDIFYVIYSAEQMTTGEELDLLYYTIQNCAQITHGKQLKIHFFLRINTLLDKFKFIPKQNITLHNSCLTRVKIRSSDIPVHEWTPDGDGIFLPGKMLTIQSVFTLSSIIQNKLDIKFSSYIDPDTAEQKQKEFQLNDNNFLNYMQLSQYNRNLDVEYKNIVLNCYGHYSGTTWDPLLFKNSSFSIVRETWSGYEPFDCNNDYVDHRLQLSEKFYRTVHVKQPFILLGGGTSVTSALKEIGIDDFSEIHGFSWENYTQGDPHNLLQNSMHKIFHEDFVKAVHKLQDAIKAQPDVISNIVEQNSSVLNDLYLKQKADLSDFTLNGIPFLQSLFKRKV